MMNRSMPHSGPVRNLPSCDWEHYELYQGIRYALSTLSSHFRSWTRVSGILASNLHSLDVALGSTLQEQIVHTLNETHSVWDPRKQYESCRFVRQSEVFPRVLLREASDSSRILLGVELYGWYPLAKDKAPRACLKVSPTVCAKQDLIVVVPWVLDSIVNGCPMVFDPFIEAAEHAAEYRNHHWKHIRQTTASREIKLATPAMAYPRRSDNILDQPKLNRSEDFGRLAQLGIMDD